MDSCDLNFKPIGYVKSWYKTKNGTPRQASISLESKGIIRLNKTFFDKPYLSLEGLEQFSHVWVLFHFHQNTNKKVRSKIKPPRLNGKSTGLFSTRSPHRPNPIGLSLCKIDKIDHNDIHLSGIDLLDETPILDIKPYIHQYDHPNFIHQSSILLIDKLIINDTSENKIENNSICLEQSNKKLNDQLNVQIPDWIKAKGVVYDAQISESKLIDLNNTISSNEISINQSNQQFEVAFTDRAIKQFNFFHSKQSDNHDQEHLIKNLKETKNFYLNFAKSSVEKLAKLNEENNNNEEKIQNLENKMNQLNEQLGLEREKCIKLINGSDRIEKQNIEKQIQMKEQIDKELNELIRKHREELNVISLQQGQKLSTLTDESSKPKEEIKIRAEIDELMSKNKELQSSYDQLIEQRDELNNILELKDAKLIELQSENDKLNLEINKYGEEIEKINQCLNEETTLVETAAINEFTKEKEAIEFERSELEKQIEELKSALSQSKDEYIQLVKQHQEDMFRLSEAMNKKPDDYKLRADMQNLLKELKCKEDQLIELQAEVEKRSELTQQGLILIKKLKANERERSHSMYMLKQKLNEQESKIKNYYDLEVENKRLKYNLKCTEDSYALERKIKERYYKELIELDRRKLSCPECTKLDRSNSIRFNATVQTLIYKDPSNPKLIQKIPNLNKYLMEDEEGQFMTTTHINEACKQETEFNDQEDFDKRLNILQQRNARQKTNVVQDNEIENDEIQQNIIMKSKDQDNDEINESCNLNSVKCKYCFDFLNSPEEAKRAIINILTSDPRSSYRRNKCSDRLYYISIDTMHITCWFDEDEKIIEIVKIKPNYM